MARNPHLGRNTVAAILLSLLPLTTVAGGPAVAQMISPPGMDMGMGGMGAGAPAFQVSEPTVVQFIATFSPIIEGARAITGAPAEATPNEVLSRVGDSPQSLPAVDSLVMSLGWPNYPIWLVIYTSIQYAYQYVMMDPQTQAMMAAFAPTAVPPPETIAAISAHLDELAPLVGL